MDKDSTQQSVHLQADAPADALSVSEEKHPAFSVDLDDWVLTSAQRTFIQSLLGDDEP